MKLVRVVLVCAAAFGLTIQVARACPGKRGDKRGGGHGVFAEARCAKTLLKVSAGHLKEALGVSDDQLKRIDPVRYNFLSKAIRYKASIQQNKLMIRRLMAADQPDQAKVLREMRKARGAKGAMMEELVKAYLKVLRNLTPDQRKRFRKHCSHGKGHGKGHGDMKGGGHGHKGCSCGGKGYGYGKGKGGCKGHGRGHGPKKGCTCDGKSCACDGKGPRRHK